jgi:hypothetical protein
MADISPYEVTEGSATYAEAWSSALFHAGCEASDAELLGLVRDNLEDLAPLTFYELDLEAYNLGVLAGGLLRTAQQPDWETEVAGGSPPRALLLADTAAVEQPEDPELLAKVIEAVDARNLELGTEIDPMLERMTSPAHYRVALPLAWVAGSFSLSGFYSLIEVDGQPEAWVSYSALHEAVGGAQIQVEEHTVLFATPTPCEVPMGEDGWLVATIPVEMLVDVGGSFTSADPNVSFTDLPASVVADDDGLDWLCPSEFAMAPEPVFPIAVLRDAEGAIVSVDVWRR